jgi:hypothetical protein
MANKRNAALEMLQGAGFEPSPEQAPVEMPAGGIPTPKNLVPLKPKKAGKAVTKVMVYMPAKVARKFKEIAFTEDRKANDVYLDALDEYLTKQGHGGIKGVVER